MLLKSLKLENIRSYRQNEVNFPPGTTLFEGDIGSGKTTILMAIEFALFGLGSEKAGALLRTGESKGTVNLCFEVDGGEYEIQRTLVKKGRLIQQKEGCIKSEDGVLYLPPSELKEKMLEILNFNEPPEPKAQSNIYRYAVFTPQEEMKAILFMRPDARLQTLRKAFRIEDYKIACDNSQSITTRTERRSSDLRARASDLNEKKSDLNSELQEILRYETELKDLLSQEQEFTKILKKMKEQRGSLKDEREKLSKVKGKIPELETKIKDQHENKAEFENSVESALKKIRELENELDELLKTQKPTDKSIDQLTEELKELKRRQLDLVKSQSTIETKIQDYLHVEKKGICPTCDREAEPTEFKVKIEQKRKENEKTADFLAQCNMDIENNQKLIERLRKYNEAQNKIEDYKIQKEEQQRIYEKNNLKAKNLSEEIETTNKRLEKSIEELKEFEKLTDELDKLDNEVDKADKSWREARDQVLIKKTKIEDDEKEADKLKKEIATMEESIIKSGFLSEYTIWLRDYFIPTVENIERHVLITINQEFNQLFQHWFSLLVEDPTKDARIDEEFTPIVEQDGYEQDIYYLSGGERTSVALAYRLALNILVRKVSTGMKSNLLILDEPTDGFSKEQLFKIQDILKELQCPQIIIVSHEKELESFADQVFRVTKLNGVSSIES
ncbi:MAG: SMC family ATPase [Candidatus Bathyarchaeota archaeon]